MVTVLLSLLAAFLYTQDPVQFEPKAAVNQKSAVKVESSLTLEILTVDAEGENKQLMTFDRKEAFSQNILEVEGNIVRKLQVSCTASSLRKTVEGKTPKDRITSMQGKTFDVALGESIDVTLVGDGVTPREADSLGSWELYSRILPTDAKKPGDMWKVRAKSLGRFLWAKFEESDGEFEVHFKKLEGTHATLSLKGQLSGKTKEGFEGELVLAETSLVFDLKSGRPVAFQLTGSLRLTKKILDVRPKPGSLTENITTEMGTITLKTTRMIVSISFK